MDKDWHNSLIQEASLQMLSRRPTFMCTVRVGVGGRRCDAVGVPLKQ